MPRTKTNRQKAIEPQTVVVSSFHIEDDQVEEAIGEQRQQFRQAYSLGNGGYLTRARAMSDDL